MLVRDQQNRIFPRKGPEPEVGYARLSDTGKIDTYLRMPQIAAIFPTDLKFPSPNIVVQLYKCTIKNFILLYFKINLFLVLEITYLKKRTFICMK